MSESGQESGREKSHKPNGETKRHRRTRFGAEILTRLRVTRRLVTTPQGREILSNPEYRKLLYDYEARAGLIEGAIFTDNLYYPNDDGLLGRKNALAGQWVAYDFNREREFGPKVKERGRSLQQGRILTFPLGEIIDNPPNKMTPISLFNIYNADHVLKVETPTIETLISYGFVEQVTYAEAYQSTDNYEQYAKLLKDEGAHDRLVYRITPKGNTLVRLEQDGGQKRKVPKRLKSVQTALGT